MATNSSSKTKKNNSKAALSDSQFANVGWVNRQFSEHPTRGLTPQKLSEIMKAAEQGSMQAQSDLFLDMEERDAHIYSEMSKRKRALLTIAYSLQPPSNPSAAEEKICDEVKAWFAGIDDFEDVILDALDAVGHGFSAQEISWARVGNVWLPESITHHNPRNFQLPTMMSGLPLDEVRLRDTSINGAQLWDFGWFVHTHKAKSGYLARGGLHRILAWPYLFKNYSVRDLAEFLEIYGIPPRIGTYPNGASDAEKMTLLRAVTQIGHGAAGIMPQGMLIDFKEAAKGNADPFQAMIKWCELSQSKAILGGTLTTQADGKTSTNALGSVHNEVRKELIASDARQLASSINKSLIDSLMRLNKPEIDPRRYPKFVFDLSEPEDIAVWSDALPKLVGVGVKIPTAWAQQKLGIPLPAKDEDVLGVAASAAPPANNAVAANAQSQPLPSPPPEGVGTLYVGEQQAIEAQHALDGAVDGVVIPTLQANAATMFAPIIVKLQEANGYDEAFAMLQNLLPDSADDEIMSDLQGLLVAANVYGRLAVKRA